MNFDRREFIKLGAGGVAGSSLLAGCTQQENEDGGDNGGGNDGGGNTGGGNTGDGNSGNGGDGGNNDDQNGNQTSDNGTSGNETENPGITRPTDKIWDTETEIEMPEPRTGIETVSVGKNIFVIGGISEENPGGTGQVLVYDTENFSWGAIKPIPEKLHHTSAVTYNGDIYIFGGYRGGYPEGEPLNSVWKFNVRQNRWEALLTLPTPRGALSSAVINDRIYVVGGSQNQKNGAMPHIEVYNPKKDKWDRLRDMPTPREQHALVSMNGKLHAIGGHDRGKLISSNEIFYPWNESWRPGVDMPTSRSSMGVSVHGEEVFVFGGLQPGGGSFKEIEIYNPGEDYWRTPKETIEKKDKENEEKEVQMPTSRGGLGAATVDDRIHTLGGIKKSGGEIIKLHEVFYPNNERSM